MNKLNGNFASPLIPYYPWKIHSSIYLDCVENGVAIFHKKIILRNKEQDGTDGSSVGIPPVSLKKLTFKFHSEPFLRRENPLEFPLEQFSDEKNHGIPYQNIFGREKTSEFRSESFLEEK